MKSIVVILGLLVAVVQAAPGESFPDDLTPMDVYMPVIEGAPEVQAPKIIGGQPALLGQFPHQAAIIIDGRTFCGGVLISRCWVLTAAHCVSEGSSFQVVLGRILWQPPGVGVVVVTTQKIVHHLYNNPVHLANDIALLHLPSFVTFNPNIRPVGLPASNAGTFVGVNATVSGFGRTTQNGGVSPILNWLDVVIISNAVCAQTFGNAIIASTICARGVVGQGTCHGDSGGPLVVRNANGSFTLIGVLSFVSSAGCDVGRPSGSARVTSFRNWIRDNTGI